VIDGLRRKIARIIAPKARYEGAWQSQGRSRIPYTLQDHRLDATRATREILGAKSRYFYRNNGFYGRFADIWEQYTVGTGLVCQPSSASDEFNAAAKAYWAGWCRFPDVSSRQTFGQLQGIWAVDWFVDGDSFVILTSSTSGYPRIQTIESHCCKTPPDLWNRDGKDIIDGVQIDATGRPQKFWFERSVGDEKRYFSVPASNVVQFFEPHRPGQYRGLPIVTPVINDLHDLDDLQILEMKACRDAAEITRVLKTSSGEMDVDRLLADGGVFQQTNSETGAGDWFQEKYGGSSVVLKSDEEFQQFMSNRPTVATMEYWKLLLSKVASGIGIPYSVAFPDSMQGTVYRATLDIAAAYFRNRSSVMAEGIRRIYEYVIGYGLASGAINDSQVPDDWWEVSIRFPRAVNVDVGYNSQAAIADLKAGIRNWDGIYGEKGDDWKVEWRKKAEQVAYRQELAEEFGIDPEQIAELRTNSAEFLAKDEPGESDQKPMKQEEADDQ
jgi:capsid protein